MKSTKIRGKSVKEKKPPRITDKRLIFLKETILDNEYCIHKPTRKQTEFLLRQELEVLYGGAAAGGKLIYTQTPITTTMGITDIEHIKVGDVVFDENGEQCIVLAVSNIEYGHDCYELTFSDGSKLTAADTHLWPSVSISDEFKNKRRTAEYRCKRRETRAKRGTGKRPDLAQRNSLTNHVYLEPPKFTNRSTKDLFETQKYRGRVNYYIPVCKPIQYPKRELLLDPYVFGVWLGDGTKYSSGITGIDQGVFEEISKRGFEVKVRRGNSCRITGLITKIKAIGCFENKHIPEVYFTGSVKQRVDLLRGLMDTDGYATKNGGCEIQLTRKELIDDVSRLLHTLGIKHTIHEGEAKLYGRVVSKKWRIKFFTNIKAFNLRRKAERQKRKGIRPVAFRRYITNIQQVPSVPTRCIQVSSASGCYLVGNSLIPTHNSDALLMAALQYAWVPDYAALILRRTYADLALSGAIMDRSLQWLTGTGAQWNSPGHKWTFPSGATLTFGYLESERDKYRYQSAEFQFIGFDELTQFTETQYSYLFSRLRRLKNTDVPLRMRAASNPGGVGHEWVKNRFKIDSGGDPERPFIGAKLDDNPHVDQEAYEEALSKLDYVTREQLRRGDWTITHSGGI
ncbi:MAG: LAGLIDADG family homing endonuclease, partial [Synergistaceae bacterium]